MVALASVGARAFASHGQANALLTVASQAHDYLFVGSREGPIAEGVSCTLVDAPVGLPTPDPSLFEAGVLVGMAHWSARVVAALWGARAAGW